MGKGLWICRPLNQPGRVSLYRLNFRQFFGGNILPTNELRVAAYAGASLAGAYRTGQDFYGIRSSGVITIAFGVPVQAEVGYVVTDNIGVHARGGVTFGVLATSLVSGDFIAGDRANSTDFLVSASFGQRNGHRVRGFRVEAGRSQGLWTASIGIGG